MIKNHKVVTEYFGYWPKFCDAKFTRFIFDKTGIIDVCIHYIDVDQSKKANIQISFSGVTEINLNDLHTENVIDEIIITDNQPYKIEIVGCYGLNGTFKCNDIEVVNVGT